MAEQSGKTVLAVNVGNGRTRFGFSSGGDLLGTWDATTPAAITEDEARAEARSVVGEILGGYRTPDGAILSCVVPAHANVWAQALSNMAATRALVVGPGLRCGVRMRQDDPSGVGADRVANVAAARERYGAPAVVVSLGTATNIEVVDAAGSFAGGIIAPGLVLGMHALGMAAARLPSVELRAPSSAIGRNTHEAMQSGLLLGEAARIDGLLDRVLGELGCDAPVVVTGSNAGLVAGLLGHEAIVDEELTLRGLVRIWHMNRG